MYVNKSILTLKSKNINLIKFKKTLFFVESLRVTFPNACIATRTVVQYIKN